ncbi:MAG: PKD domain-containing protein, partial [Anaerolineales bacterium]|nr:PKD domain-containing protein [Anaerolineales bacterium]
PPGGGGTHAYPPAADLGSPPPPPAYTDFPQHRPDVPLAAAQPGDIFLVYQGTLTDSLAWLGWNDGIAATAATLANSLTWPGDTLDYTDHGDGGQPATPLYPWVVRGYVNPVDTSDVTLGEGDWLPASTAGLGSAAVLTALQAHISQQRVLRLPVWDAQQAGSLYQARQFGLFRLRGYRGSQPGVWLLLEFAGWDSACGQRPVPASVALTGPASGWPAQPAAFVATVSPASVAVPLTYTWQAAGQPPLVHTGGVTDTAVFTWTAAGVYTVSVTVENGFGPPVTAVADFFVPWVRYLPVAWRP